MNVDMSKTWRSRSPRTFFGLNEDYMEAVYEELFALKHYGGWSFFEAYNLPNKLREWWVLRLSKEFQKEREAYEKATKNRNTTG